MEFMITGNTGSTARQHRLAHGHWRTRNNSFLDLEARL